MEKIILSIIIPCFNHGKYINECVESILNYKKLDQIEVIIINDGSTDLGFTKQILDDIKHPIVKVIHQENLGLAKTRNNLINIAKGIFILPLDADNFLNSNFIDKCLGVLQYDTSIDIVYTDRMLVYENGKEKLSKTGSLDLNWLSYRNSIDACAIYKKSIWIEVGGYSEDMPVMGYEDWDFWIKCCEKGFKFKYLDETYFFYRVLENSMIQTAIEKRTLVLSYLFINRLEFYKKITFNLLKEKNYQTRKPIRYILKILFGKFKN